MAPKKPPTRKTPKKGKALSEEEDEFEMRAIPVLTQEDIDRMNALQASERARQALNSKYGFDDREEEARQVRGTKRQANQQPGPSEPAEKAHKSDVGTSTGVSIPYREIQPVADKPSQPASLAPQGSRLSKILSNNLDPEQPHDDDTGMSGFSRIMCTRPHCDMDDHLLQINHLLHINGIQGEFTFDRSFDLHLHTPEPTMNFDAMSLGFQDNQSDVIPECLGRVDSIGSLVTYEITLEGRDNRKEAVIQHSVRSNFDPYEGLDSKTKIKKILKELKKERLYANTHVLATGKIIKK